MAIEKVGVYRKYHGKVPTDKTGKKLPKEFWLKKRPFRWAARWYGSDGKRYSKSFKTRKEAELYANKQQSQVEEGRTDTPASISFYQFASEHETIMRHQVARGTLREQVRALRMFMEHTGKHIPLKNITPKHAEAFIAARLNSGVKIATANKDIRTLRGIFNLAIEPRGYMTAKSNPFRKIRQRKISAKPVRYIKPDEFKALYDATTDLWWKTFFSVAYTSAARTGELINLMWTDIDFELNRIRIVCKEAEGNLRSWEPKDHEGRVLPVPAEVIQLLADLQATSAEGCPYAFIPAWRWENIKLSQKAGTWHDDKALLNNLNKRFHTLRRQAGVAKCTMHDFRRSCITNWARHLPIHVVQQLAGHSKIETTRLYYLAVEESDLERARKVQEKILRTDQTDPLLTHSPKNEGFSC